MIVSDKLCPWRPVGSGGSVVLALIVNENKRNQKKRSEKEKLGFRPLTHNTQHSGTISTAVSRRYFSPFELLPIAPIKAVTRRSSV